MATTSPGRSTKRAPCLTADELDVASLYWDIGELGDMHHNPAKNVLHRKYTLEETRRPKPASRSAELRSLIDSARRKLLAARAERPTPFIDRTLYTGWNAMAVTAYLEAARVLRMDARAGVCAAHAHHACLPKAWDGDDIAACTSSPIRKARPLAERVPGTLDDYAFTVHACIDAWLASGEMRFYRAAVKLADAMIARFYDRTAGAFYDTRRSCRREARRWAHWLRAASRCRIRRRPPAIPPRPPLCCVSKLLSGRAEYREIAEDTLASFAGIVEHFGLYAGSYGLALERLLLDPMQVVIVGTGAEADRLEATAVSGFAVNKTVIRLAPSQLVPGESSRSIGRNTAAGSRAGRSAGVGAGLPGRTCLPPITDPDALAGSAEHGRIG